MDAKPRPAAQRPPGAPLKSAGGGRAASPPRPRAAARATVEFYLRQAEIVGGMVEGDLILGFVLLAMGSANVWRATRSADLSARFDDEQAVPDALKTPISVSALAASLGLPFETARRYVGRLNRMGMCAKQDGGWIVPAEVLSGEEAGVVLGRTVANVRQFIQALRAAGVDVDAIG